MLPAMRTALLAGILGCAASAPPPAPPTPAPAERVEPADVPPPDPAPPPAPPASRVRPLVVGSLPLLGDTTPDVAVERVVDDWVALRWPDREGLAVQRVSADSAWASADAAMATARKQAWPDAAVEELADGLVLTYGAITDGDRAMFALIAYRTIAGETYFCAGSARTAERRDDMVAFCRSLRPRTN